MWMLHLPQQKPMTLNHRDHWSVKAKKTAELVDTTLVLAREAKIPRGLSHIEVTLYYGPKDRRTRDPLNLTQTLKACEDGLVRAGVVPDDNPTYVTSTMPVILDPGGALNRKGGRLWLLVVERTPVG